MYIFMEIPMTKQVAYPLFAFYLVFCSLNSFSTVNSMEYEPYYKQDLTNLNSISTSNHAGLINSQQISDTEMEDFSDKENSYQESSETQLFYKKNYNLSVYSDSKYDDDYTPPLRISNKKWARCEKEHINDWIENLRELKDSTNTPTIKELHNCFLNTRHIDILYRQDYLNKKTGNQYYTLRGLTPIKDTPTENNLELISKRKTPVWVNKSTGKITSYCFHHLSQSNVNELLVMMPQEVHWEYSKLFHQRNDKSTVDRNDFGKEKPQVLKAIYNNGNNQYVPRELKF